MRNYRRLSGDGSVKVVLSGDSNSPPKTTSRREPLPYNSSPAQELRPFVACAPRVRVPAPSRRQALPLSLTAPRQYVEFRSDVPPKFQKKPVFAHIRGLFSGPG